MKYVVILCYIQFSVIINVAWALLNREGETREMQRRKHERDNLFKRLQTLAIFDKIYRVKCDFTSDRDYRQVQAPY